MLEAHDISRGNNVLIGSWSFVCVAEVDHSSQVSDVSRYYRRIVYSRICCSSSSLNRHNHALNVCMLSLADFCMSVHINKLGCYQLGTANKFQSSQHILFTREASFLRNSARTES